MPPSHLSLFKVSKMLLRILYCPRMILEITVVSVYRIIFFGSSQHVLDNRLFLAAQRPYQEPHLRHDFGHMEVKSCRKDKESKALHEIFQRGASVTQVTKTSCVCKHPHPPKFTRNGQQSEPVFWQRKKGLPDNQGNGVCQRLMLLRRTIELHHLLINFYRPNTKWEANNNNGARTLSSKKASVAQPSSDCSALFPSFLMISVTTVNLSLQWLLVPSNAYIVVIPCNLLCRYVWRGI